MFNTLDSRALYRTDCYCQRFNKPGKYEYNVVPAFGSVFSTTRPFCVIVKESAGKPAADQHEVVVSERQGRFSVLTPELTIAAGDSVLWNSSQGGAIPFSLVSDHEFFNSSRMASESIYTHAFGLPGEVQWADAHGSGLRGKVRVKDPCCKTEADVKRWQQMLGEGVVVTIADGEAAPSELEIVCGQTVFFVVGKASGISITDVSVLAGARIPSDPCQCHEKAHASADA